MKLTGIPMERLMPQDLCLRFRFLQFLLPPLPRISFNLSLLLFILGLADLHQRTRKMSSGDHEHRPRPSLRLWSLHLSQLI